MVDTHLQVSLVSGSSQLQLTRRAANYNMVRLDGSTPPDRRKNG